MAAGVKLHPLGMMWPPLLEIREEPEVYQQDTLIVSNDQAYSVIPWESFGPRQRVEPPFSCSHRMGSARVRDRRLMELGFQ